MANLIDASRLWRRLMELAEIGALPQGGVDRQALSEGEIKAWRKVIAWGREAGLEPATDPAGNLFLSLPGRDRHAPPVMIGSHLDTQPTGGKFDGAFGVLAALEVAASLADAAVDRYRDLVVVAWMNEEGCRFAPGMMGSEAFAGVRSLESILAARDAAGTSVAAALGHLHAAFPELPRLPLGFPLAAYLEPHIEQGPHLEQALTPIGIVTGIQGKKTFEIIFRGRADHAGTQAMDRRRDAVAALARAATVLFGKVGAADPAIKFTIGRVVVEPNAPSVVPARVTIRIDLRHPDNDVLDEQGRQVEAIVRAEGPPCEVTIERLVDAPANMFDGELQRMIGAAAAELSYAAQPILSAAGHDARHMAALCPSAMIFIPCREGISHAEAEWAEPAHVTAGAEVLAHVVRRLVAGQSETGRDAA